MKKNFWLNSSFQIGALVLAFLVSTLVLVAVGAPPFKAYGAILKGAVGSLNNLENLLVSWVPLLLTTAGVLITFSAGLWNIGIEGQITFGTIFTTGALRLMQDTTLPPWVILVLGIMAGIVGGALWAGLAGVLKTFGGVNEIFGGLGLNFVATAFTIFLVFGPWKRPGVGSMSGTEVFDKSLWLPTLPGRDLSLISLGLAILAIVVVFFLLRGTYFGLRLKAVGKNMKAAYLMGVPTWQYSLMAFLICGAFAGLAGAIQVTGVYHRLLPNMSGGYGFLGLLVGMLVNYQAIWAAPVAFFFIGLNTGSIQLQMLYKLDSSFAGVLQGVLVLMVLMVEGVRQRIFRRA